VLSRKIDDVLLVVQAGNTRRPQLKQAVDQLNKSNSHLIGAVLNRLTPRINGYDSYYYRSSYYEQDIGEGDPGDSSNNEAKRRWRKRSAPEAAPETT
jgi:Mrp family chromosome partitioning ATPase